MILLQVILWKKKIRTTKNVSFHRLRAEGYEVRFTLTKVVRCGSNKSNKISI